MRRRSSTRWPAVVRLVWTVGLLGLGPANGLAQTGPPRAVTVSATFDVANAYVLRGILQEDTGVVMQPAVDVGVVLRSGDERGNGEVRASAGTWNSLHTGSRGSDGLGKLWYQSDFSAGVSMGVGAGVRVGATYLARTSPNSAFENMTEMLFDVAVPGAWGAPYARVVLELEGQLDGGRQEGRYLELGARPRFGRRVALTVPVKLGLSLGDYYEGLRGDERFGFFSVGGVATAPLWRSGGASWTWHAGADVVYFGDRNQLVAGTRQQVVVSGGLGFSY